MTVRFTKTTALAVLLLSAIAAPAIAGQWTTGGLFDAERGVGVNFIRFLAEPGEGQMTVRCDDLVGLWIDVGAAGNGELPPGLTRGDETEVTLSFVRDDGVEIVSASGPLLARADGAVLVELIGEATVMVAPLLLVPADRVDVTVAGVTRPIPLESFSDRAITLADGCEGWPVPEGELNVAQGAEAPPMIPIEAQIGTFVEQAAAGLPEFIVDAVNQCFVATTRLLTAQEVDILRQAPDFIAGINAVAQANPPLAGTLFDELDGCGGTLVTGEIMWMWVQSEFVDAAEADRALLGSCLIGPVDRLALDAKKGIMRFRNGDFAEAIQTMLGERLDLAGTIVEDLDGCGVQL
jgi:hypothetical protein